MPADKKSQRDVLPKMPEPVDSVAVFDDPREACQNSSVYPSAGEYYTADQMRAMYLAGIEAARGCVPEAMSKRSEFLLPSPAASFNACRETTLANLEALKNESVADKSADALGRE